MAQICEIFNKQQFMTEAMHGERYVDQATGEALYRHYMYWEPCTDDKEQFLNWFEDALYTYGPQYINLVRIQTTEIDPLVSEYMERQLKRYSETNAEQTQTQTGKQTTDSTTKTSHQYDHTSTAKTTHDTTDSTSSSENGSGSTQHGETIETTYDNDTTTRTPGKQTVTTQRTGSDTDTTHTQALSGELPQTTQYAANAGMPNNLNWRYGTAQQEGTSTNTHKAGTGETVTTEAQPETSVHTGGNTVTHGGTDSTTSTKASDSTVAHTGTDTTTTNEKTNGEEGDTDTTGTTGTTENSGSTKGSQSGTQSGEDREIYSGRHASPQAMLDAARRYIENMNAFKWLCRQLDDCFYLPYNIDCNKRYYTEGWWKYVY